MATDIVFQTPIGGVPYKDWTIVNYVDLEPGSGIQDFNGGNYSYNGHNAIDFTLPHFEAMDNGVPVYASLSGTVTEVTDIYPDRCSTGNPCTTPANVVSIDHGDGLITRYLHLRRNSASVTVGESIAAGQQIGYVGSSGNSSDAHLHFEVYHNGNLIEINIPGDEYVWQSPIPYADDVVGSLDYDITDHSPSFPELRERPETKDIFYQESGGSPHLWTHLHGVDQGDDLDFYFYQPDGSQYAHWHWSAPQIRYGWWIAAINLPEQADLGVWEVEFQHNDTTLFTDTFTVKSEINVIQGDNNRNVLKGTQDADLITGLGGNDKLKGKGSDDIIHGGPGNDRVLGNQGDDILTGGNGTDKLFGGQGADDLNGGPGNDTLHGNGGPDTFRFESDLLDGIADIDKIKNFQAQDILNFSEYLNAGGSIEFNRVKAGLLKIDLNGEDMVKVFGSRNALNAAEVQLMSL